LKRPNSPPALLEECWRVLGPGGQGAFHRAEAAPGLWARTDGTPFGYGRPYSMRQLDTLLRRQHNFTAERLADGALCAAHPSKRFWLQDCADVGACGGAAWRRFMSGGVLMLEVSKQVQAPLRPGLKAPWSSGR
jgi:hypothetical protein